MAGKYRRSYRIYSAWNYGKEIEDLNRASEQGWQLVRGGCFHSKFEKNPDIRYRYQLYFRKVENMGRFIETFREQGWEYVNSTFNGWHYFRKLYDPSLPEEAYEIFTDQESLQEMNSRWATLALIIGGLISLFALFSLIRLIREPRIPSLVQLLTFVFEGAILLRGGLLMRDSSASRSRRGDSVLLTLFFIGILVGAGSSIALTELRPNLCTQQQADAVSESVTDNRWVQFDIRYPDYYYLDLTAEGEEPLTFAIVNGEGEEIYSRTGTEIRLSDERIKLKKGEYSFSMSCTSGFRLDCVLR